MHIPISALLTLGLALSVIATPNPAKTRTRNRTKTKTKTISPTTATTTTTSATSTSVVEQCSPGSFLGFDMQCNTYVSNNNYSNDSNSLTRQANTIASCIDICSLTPNCCGGNFNIFATEVQGVPGCTILLKPFNEPSCDPESSYVFESGELANDNVAFVIP